MSAAARGVVIVAALGGLAGLGDGAWRGMEAGEALAASGWCAMVAGGTAALAVGVAAGLTRAWSSEPPALASMRAWLVTTALGVWAAGLVALGDRFAAQYSAIELAALLWAVIGVAIALWLGLLVEPVARRLAGRWPLLPADARARQPGWRLASVALAIAVIGLLGAAIVRGAPTDPGSLGAMAARGLGSG